LTADLQHAMLLLAGIAGLLLATGLTLAWRMGGRIAGALEQLEQPFRHTYSNLPKQIQS
jgi:hypothetical protein